MLLLPGDGKARASEFSQGTDKIGIGKIAMASAFDVDKDLAIAGQRIVHRDLICDRRGYTIEISREHQRWNGDVPGSADGGRRCFGCSPGNQGRRSCVVFTTQE